MTAINKDGQMYWTFEELDFNGAIQDLFNVNQVLIDERVFVWKKLLNLSHHDVDYKYYKEFYEGIMKYLNERLDNNFKIMSYLDSLSNGGRF